VGELFEGYGAGARGLTEAAFDEMLNRQDGTRESYAAVAISLAKMGPVDVSARASRLARAFMDQGVTFDLDGEERPFPLDVVPRIFTAAEWKRVAEGVAQQVRALEMFLLSRYVSGYFHPDPGASVGEEVTGESHAWIELWTGTWWGYDPTNDCPIGPRHVAVGSGRDYADVPPVKGIYAGNAENAMKVAVRMTRIH
jgi:hypothetical protein